MCGPHHCLGRDAFASGPEILLRLLQLRQNASILEQGCAGFSPGSANRCDQCTRHSGRTSPPLCPSLSFRYTHPAIIDTGYGPRVEEIADGIVGAIGRAPRWVIDTHWHFDHADGNAAFARADATVVAHTNCRTRLSTNQYVPS